MPFQLKKIEHPSSVGGYSKLMPGDWWYCPWYLDCDWREWDYWSAMYRALPDPVRPPVCISMPGGDTWLIDAKSSNGEGWHITGEEGLWTASPSILVPRYHGYLRAGWLTDDIDGRRY